MKMTASSDPNRDLSSAALTFIALRHYGLPIPVAKCCWPNVRSLNPVVPGSGDQLLPERSNKVNLMKRISTKRQRRKLGLPASLSEQAPNVCERIPLQGTL